MLLCCFSSGSSQTTAAAEASLQAQQQQQQLMTTAPATAKMQHPMTTATATVKTLETLACCVRHRVQPLAAAAGSPAQRLTLPAPPRVCSSRRPCLLVSPRQDPIVSSRVTSAGQVGHDVRL